ncbi:UNVERIFIED_CONTAM: hypothetical protein K2H54_045702 [Gekko kuhli]
MIIYILAFLNFSDIAPQGKNTSFTYQKRREKRMSYLSLSKRQKDLLKGPDGNKKNMGNLSQIQKHNFPSCLQYNTHRQAKEHRGRGAGRGRQQNQIVPGREDNLFSEQRSS